MYASIYVDNIHCTSNTFTHVYMLTSTVYSVHKYTGCLLIFNISRTTPAYSGYRMICRLFSLISAWLVPGKCLGGFPIYIPLLFSSCGVESKAVISLRIKLKRSISCDIVWSSYEMNLIIHLMPDYSCHIDVAAINLRIRIHLIRSFRFDIEAKAIC